MASPKLIQAMEAGVDGAKGFLNLKPERSQIGWFWESFAGQRLNLCQYRLPLFSWKVGGQWVDITWLGGLDWRYMDGLYRQLSSRALVHSLQHFRPACLQLRNSPVHRHGPQLELTAVRHHALQHVHPGLVCCPYLLRAKHRGVGRCADAPGLFWEEWSTWWWWWWILCSLEGFVGFVSGHN